MVSLEQTSSSSLFLPSSFPINSQSPVSTSFMESTTHSWTDLIFQSVYPELIGALELDTSTSTSALFVGSPGLSCLLKLFKMIGNYSSNSLLLFSTLLDKRNLDSCLCNLFMAWRISTGLVISNSLRLLNF